MVRRRFFQAAWGGLLGAAVALEVAALATRDEDSDTATAHIRYTLGIDPPKTSATIARAAIVAGCWWLARHLTQPPKREEVKP